MSLEWTDLDSRAVITAKTLAGDAVEQAGSGHPGTAISLAPLAYLLFQRHMKLDPKIKTGSDATGSSCPPATPP